MMKGFLKSNESVLPLSPTVTVIGREKCDIVIASTVIEAQHAIIEYSEQETCFVLQDLNTAHGTYVNECRVQNAAVRLSPGDIIRFGYCGTPYQLDVENAPQVSCPPVQQHAAWNSQLTMINHEVPLSSQESLPHLSSYSTIDSKAGSQSQLPVISAAYSVPGVSSPTSSAWQSTTPWPPTSQPVNVNMAPRPPKPRPSSAGTRRGSVGGVNVITQASPTNSPLPPRRVTSGWVSSAGARTILTSQQNLSSSPNTRASPVNEMMALHEKEQKMLRMGDEINRLAVFEAESQRKDSVIGSLRDEVNRLQLQLQEASRTVVPDSSYEQHVKTLEGDVRMKELEINALRLQMSKMRPESSDPMENFATLRSILNTREKELVVLKLEVEKMKKDRASTATLLTSLNRDVNNKETMVNRLKGEIEIVKRELREKDVSLSAMTAKFSRVRETKRHEEEMAGKNKEIITLKHQTQIENRNREELEKQDKQLISMKSKLKGLENKLEEQTNIIANKQQEIDEMKADASKEKQVHENLKSEANHSKTQFVEMQKAKITAKEKAEEAEKKYERLRSRILQTTLSAPGFKMPDVDETNDDILVDTMKKLINDRTEVKNKMKEMKESVKSHENYKKEAKNSIKALKQHLTQSEKRLQDGGRTCSHLRDEVKLLQSVTVDESLQGVRDTIAMIMQDELSWQQEYESALEKCGWDVKSADQNMSKFILGLKSKCDSLLKDKELISTKLSTIETKVRSETQTEIQKLTTEHKHTLDDTLEKLRLENEKKLQAALEENKQIEEKKHKEVQQSNQSKIRQQEESLQELRKTLVEKSSNEERLSQVEKELRNEIKNYIESEGKLKEDLIAKDQAMKGEAAKLVDQITELKESHTKEAKAFKEQIHQHSLTIVSHEEKVTKFSKEIKDLKNELHSHKEQLEEKSKQARDAVAKLREKQAKEALLSGAKPKIPPKPVLINGAVPDVMALERLVNVLKKDNIEMKKEIQNRQDIIIGLRRDLAGASARLSDLTGELSEKQKLEIENSRVTIRQQDAELSTQRQQLMKLSELVDQQSAKITSMQQELDTQSEELSGHKSKLTSSADEVLQLRNQLVAEQENKAKALQQVQQEGLITSELSSVGAQCRGERHDQVISRQREALAELRSRIKGLEVNRPPLPTHDQALQQVILLKRELAELRAKQAQVFDTKNVTAESILDREVARVRGSLNTMSGSSTAIERSVRVEVQQAMEHSERTYLDLAQSCASVLGLGEISGQESMAHLPQDERERLVKDRERANEIIASRIKVLNQRLDRKDEILRDYEKDLERLREAEKIAGEKSNQVESLANDVRGRSEETLYLRETLRRTRHQLDQEKRLNGAIKSKKTFHLENDEKSPQMWPKHKCFEEVKPKKEAKSKVAKNKLIRKNYEIEALKAELNSREDQLCDTTTRLINLENAIGLAN
ncbi:forkhead-associated domain-containing protein 1-like isoform X2 [Anneissia japonica]|uniref:forkhead-associated domain-containing protein 1-like isoform X2 n=1 Tax=Anneissia japonica TaxID=1529436 RepID=UPI0014255E6B|nr:forkhead-associated domain-containing protein 1-like isoform X2 [Anneissia japonica]